MVNAQVGGIGCRWPALFFREMGSQTLGKSLLVGHASLSRSSGVGTTTLGVAYYLMF